MRCCCLREVELSWYIGIGIMVVDWTDEYVLMPLERNVIDHESCFSRITR